MRNLIVLLFSCVYLSAGAQQSPFVRVYDLTGIKIHSGRVFAITDSTLQLKNDSSAVVSFRNIGFIKTKRSAGHNVIVGTAIGAIAGAILGGATAEPDKPLLGYTVGEGILLGLIGGGMNGASVGALTALAKKSQTLIINGDATKWATVKALLAPVNNAPVAPK